MIAGVYEDKKEVSQDGDRYFDVSPVAVGGLTTPITLREGRLPIWYKRVVHIEKLRDGKDICDLF